VNDLVKMAKRHENLIERFKEFVGNGSDMEPSRSRSSDDDDVLVFRGQGSNSRSRLRLQFIMMRSLKMGLMSP